LRGKGSLYEYREEERRQGRGNIKLTISGKGDEQIKGGRDGWGCQDAEGYNCG